VTARPLLVLANHMSWLDIFVINASLPAAFVSKEDVRHWPIAGWLAARNDTIFLKRGSRGHARLINQEIAAVLARDKLVAVFPEGTTTDHHHLNLYDSLRPSLRPSLSASLCDSLARSLDDSLHRSLREEWTL
jgi:1-acyl-sn-glycerol-3-phosphate acyltransferase